MSTLVLEHSERVGSDHLGETLRDFGHRLRVLRLYDGDVVPPDLDDVDAIVTCGGAPSPLDDSLPWIAAELDLLRAAHERGIPIVGICLGCQLLGRALGGEVTALPAEKDGGAGGATGAGIECGWHEVTLTPGGREDPIFAGQPWRSMQLHWHRFHVSKLPPGARGLAKSVRTPNQAWALGLRTYAIQYHPEIHARRIEEWAAQEPRDLKDAGLDLATLRKQTEERFATFERLARRQFETIAMVLMPMDRRYSGQVPVEAIRH